MMNRLAAFLSTLVPRIMTNCDYSRKGLTLEIAEKLAFIIPLKHHKPFD